VKIEVLGSGCPACKKLYEMTQKAVRELGMKEKVEYFTGDKGINKLIELGAMSSPVIAINNKIVMVGFTPNLEKIKSVISKAKEER